MRTQLVNLITLNFVNKGITLINYKPLSKDRKHNFHLFCFSFCKMERNVKLLMLIKIKKIEHLKKKKENRQWKQTIHWNIQVSISRKRVTRCCRASKIWRRPCRDCRDFSNACCNCCVAANRSQKWRRQKCAWMALWRRTDFILKGLSSRPDSVSQAGRVRN